MLVQCLSSMFASAFFGMLLKQPRDTLVHTSLIGLNGYILFLLLHQSTFAYFAAALMVGLLCELTARIKERTTTLYLVSAIIPLVPGLGLYRTIMYAANNDYDQALATGSATIAGIGAIALALTIATVVFTKVRLPVRNDSPSERN
jgi:uncharacterized membrane protein YjjB (DUF3815 family)